MMNEAHFTFTTFFAKVKIWEVGPCLSLFIPSHDKMKMQIYVAIPFSKSGQSPEGAIESTMSEEYR